MNYDSILKRANKLIDKAKSRLNISKVHIVNNDSDISKLSGLVIILHPDHKNLLNNHAQAKQELADSDFKENI